MDETELKETPKRLLLATCQQCVDREFYGVEYKADGTCLEGDPQEENKDLQPIALSIFSHLG